MKVKNIVVDDNGNPVLEESKPVFEFEDGSKAPVDVPSLFEKIGSLNNEAKNHRLKAKELEEKYSVFDEIEKPEEFLKKAKEALSTVENLKDKELVEAEKVEQLKRSVAESYQQKIKTLEENLQSRIKELEEIGSKDKATIRSLMIKGAFDSSKFITEKTVLTPDIAYSAFGNNFRIEEVDGEPQVLAYDSKGERIFSIANPGEPASTEEAIEIIFNKHPQKDSLLIADSSGSGRKSMKETKLGAKTYSLDEWNLAIQQATPEEERSLIQKKARGEVVVKT